MKSEPRINTDEHGCDWEKITSQVIGCAFKVSNTLGVGFLEKVYENALSHELRKAGVRVSQQQPITIRYHDVVVGEYAADLMVEDTVLVELKVCRAFDDIHMAQCMNYLKATARPVCLLLNFGTSRIQMKRILNPAIPEAWIHTADDASWEDE
jgi:GxxExxY protein